MATIGVTDEGVEIELTTFERVFGLLKDQVVELDHIDSVAVDADPHQAIKGLRAPGLGVPFSTKIGTWRGHGRRLFVCVHRDEPTVRIELTERVGYDAFIVSVAHPESVAAAIERARPRS